MVRDLDFLRAGALGKFHDAIQKEEYRPSYESLVKNGPHFTDSKENGGPED